MHAHIYTDPCTHCRTPVPEAIWESRSELCEDCFDHHSQIAEEVADSLTVEAISPGPLADILRRILTAKIDPQVRQHSPLQRTGGQEAASNPPRDAASSTLDLSGLRLEVLP